MKQFDKYLVDYLDDTGERHLTSFQRYANHAREFYDHKQTADLYGHDVDGLTLIATKDKRLCDTKH